MGMATVGLLLVGMLYLLATRLRSEPSSERFRALVDSMPHLVWSCRPDGACDYVSPQWVAYTGRAEKEQLAFGWLEHIHPHDRDLVLRRWLEAMEQRQPFDSEFRIRRSDGAYRWFKTRATPTRHGWVGTNTDIQDLRDAHVVLRQLNLDLEARVEARTRELRQAQTELEQRLERKRLAVLAAREGVWDWDIQADSLTWDAMMFELYGLDPKSCSGNYQDWSNALHPEDRAATEKAFERALNGEEQLQTSFRIVRGDGQTRYLHAVAEVVRGPDGNAERLIGLNWDVTAEREAAQARRASEAELERSNRDLAGFAYAASHDLQEPLRAVSGCSTLLKRRYGGQLDEQADELLGHIVDGAARMQRLILDLLAYSQVHTRGTQPLPVATAETLREAMLLLEGALGEAQAEVTWDELPLVTADASQLRQLLQNLLSNAVKYRSGHPPRIHVGVRQRPGWWEFSVADNGIGIEPQYHARIFQLFQRLHTRSEYPGTGIGLALCHKIVTRHGGQLWVQSELGAGSTFYFTLPGTGGSGNVLTAA